ncbi:hypothetical protein Sgleb_43630 [Streptomyces glebosus]|uniref:Lipoprotein n=1 Tax=Streptomyces glebosus TaxID=249580 RepID=A0A640T213_9ACTN|nr:hypothetical protein [Streptomyces glebosus]GFE16316.1 hypothetical protein Sgleb_43630 [Streptomyces glebosus]
MNGRVRNVLPSSSRGRRAKAAMVGAMALAASLCLSITPAQADGGGFGGMMTQPSDVPKPTGGDWLDDPQTRAEFLANCGEKCTITSGEFVSDPVEGAPERVSEFHDTCNVTGSFTYKEEETNGNGLVVSMGLKIPAVRGVEVLPKIDYTEIHTQTTGITDTVNQNQTYTIYWLDKVPMTQTLRGNWSYEGDGAKGLPAREFKDVEADVTYNAFRKQSRPMTEEEKVSRCGNASPS